MSTDIEKICFVTVGATASFNELVEATLQPSFLKALSRQAYTKIIIQYGKSGSTFFNTCLSKAGNTGAGIIVEGFDFKSGDFREALRDIAAGDGRQEGLLIAHAGSC
jgi:beta-1,4-N-acetylglucosaminyltransferase